MKFQRYTALTPTLLVLLVVSSPLACSVDSDPGSRGRIDADAGDEGTLDAGVDPIGSEDPYAPFDGAQHDLDLDSDLLADGTDPASTEVGWDSSFEDIPLTELVAGSVTYLDRPYDEDGFLSETILSAAPFVTVELVVVRDGEIVASTEAGEDGTFSFQLDRRFEEPVRLEVVSTVHRDHHAVRVLDRYHIEPYRVPSETFVLPEVDEAPFWIDVDIDFDEEAPAFNILDVATTALERLRGVLSDPIEDLPQLTILWQHDKPSLCGTCYNSNVIDLQGSADDPDGYDDDIILHEVGHFVQQNLSVDDSPGGAHDGSPTDPRLAYSEGFATFFSCWARQSPTYQDYLASGWKFREHEVLREEYLGTSDGELGGLVSEILVTSLLWDLFDDSPDEPHDQMRGDDLWPGALFETMRNAQWHNVGAFGADLADFIEAVRCRLENEDSLRTLVESTEYPFDFSEPAECPSW